MKADRAPGSGSRERSPAVARALDAASRITPAALLVRGVTFGSTAVALLLAMPSFLFTARFIAAAVVAAALVALAPGTRIVTLVLALAVVGWTAAWMGRLAEVSAVQVVALSSVLFLAHSSAALAALIPFDAVVSPEVLIRWYARALGVVAVSVVIALLLLVGVALAAGFNGAAIASLAGLAAVVALVVILVRMTRQKSTS